MKIGVLASGRGSNLAAIMENIQNGRIDGEIVLVLSDKEDAFALQRAKEAGIKSLALSPRLFADRKEYDKSLAGILKEHNVELVVLAGFMRILTSAFLDSFPMKVLNIHPALLPSFPGLHAQRQAVNYGVKVSGCTVHFVDSGMDSGPIIAQKTVPVLQDDNEDSLAQRILLEEHLIYSQVIADICQGKIYVEGRQVFHK